VIGNAGAVVTLGIGSFIGDPNHIVTLGYGTGAAPVVIPPPDVPVNVVGDGEFISWKDELEARHRKRQLESLLAKYGRQEKKLVQQKEKTERTIQAERRQNKPVDGILARYLELDTKITEVKAEIRSMEQEYSGLMRYLGMKIQEIDDDEHDIEVLLLGS